MRIIRLLIYIKDCLSFYNVISSIKIFFYSILKQNTRYPNYLLNFEKEVSNYFGSKYALSFSNGTTACIALLYSLGVKKNSKIIISKLTFPSIISSILRIGAIPVYLDFDKNLQIKENINKNEILSADFLLVTHVYGLPQKMDRIRSILKLNKKLLLIEDISHAQGAIIDNQMIGTLGEGSFMSMQGDKAINAGEGGIVFTNSNHIYNRLIYLSHLNRKTSENNNINLLSKIGFIGKGRMNPLGAITALSDIKNLHKRNKIISAKIKIIYEGLKDLKNFYVPKIDNYNHLGGFHYGIPFFCESESLLKNIKSKFKIVKYNWPILDANEHFHDPNKFLDLIYDNDPKIQNVFEKSNDIRDQLYFFDLKEIINLSEQKIKKRINIIKKNEN
jgi:dTDP-4-amino-4,6-dideoxygalactose transaminase